MHKKTLRQLKILFLLPSAPTKVGTRKLVDQLNGIGMEANVRAVQRDLTELSDAFPIVSDHASPAGWSWARGSARAVPSAIDPFTAVFVVLVATHLRNLVPDFLVTYLQDLSPKAEAMIAGCGDSRLKRWRSQAHMNS